MSGTDRSSVLWVSLLLLQICVRVALCQTEIGDASSSESTTVPIDQPPTCKSGQGLCVMPEMCASMFIKTRTSSCDYYKHVCCKRGSLVTESVLLGPTVNPREIEAKAASSIQSNLPFLKAARPHIQHGSNSNGTVSVKAVQSSYADTRPSEHSLGVISGHAQLKHLPPTATSTPNEPANGNSRTNKGASQHIEFPGLVAIIYKYRRQNYTEFICEGTLITSRSVLTTAICLHQYRNIVNTLSVRVGHRNLRSATSRSVDVSIQKLIFHPEFDPSWILSDIAVIILDEAVDLEAPINLISLPPAEFSYTDMSRHGLKSLCWDIDPYLVSGSASTLKLRSFEPLQCLLRSRYRFWNPQFYQDPSVICEDKPPGQTPCITHLGSPVVSNILGTLNRYHLIGITSFHLRRSHMTVMTNVTSFQEWINKVLTTEGLLERSYDTSYDILIFW